MVAHLIWIRHWLGKTFRFRRAHNPSAISFVVFTFLATNACTPSGSPTPLKPRTASHSPIQLTSYDMDRVSAAGVSVEMDSSALVSGHFGQADTDVMTGIVSLGPNVIGYGFGSGEGIACCGEDSEVQLDMTASGAGDYVFADTHMVYGGDGVTKVGVAQGIVLALSGPSRDELAAATKDYIGHLAQAPPSTYRPSTGHSAQRAAR